MTINEYLDRCKALRTKADWAKDRYKELASISTSPGSSLNTDGLPGAHDVHKREKILTALAQWRETWVNAEYDYLLFRAELFNQICEIKSLPDLEVMFSRYVRGMTIEQVCEYMAKVNCGTPMSRTCVHRHIKSGKRQLLEILRDQGVDIDDGDI